MLVASSLLGSVLIESVANDLIFIKTISIILRWLSSASYITQTTQADSASYIIQIIQMDSASYITRHLVTVSFVTPKVGQPTIIEH
jgi:hypothetical protein